MKVTVIEVDGKQARKLIWRDIKQNRRNQKLKRLIGEVRMLRKARNRGGVAA